MTGIIIIGVVGIGLLTLSAILYDKDIGEGNLIGLSLALGMMCTLISIISLFLWFDAKNEILILNKLYDTDFTTQEFFWNRYRITEYIREVVNVGK
jgi:hypothetical protein